MVPGHRDLYKEAGITKQQIKVGRTKIIQQTPEQEHQSRADGTPIIHKRKPEELVLVLDGYLRLNRDVRGGSAN